MKVLMKKLLKGVVALTVLAGILITVDRFIPVTSPLSSDMGTPFAYLGLLLLFPAAVGLLLLLCGAAGWFVVWAVSRVARDKGAGKVGVASGSIATVGVIILVTLVFNYMTSPPDGPFEQYDRNGQLVFKTTVKDGEMNGPFEGYSNGQLGNKGTYKDGERHGPWEVYQENGQLLLKGNFNANERVRDDWGTESAECGEWFEEGETVTYDPCPPDLEDGN